MGSGPWLATNPELTLAKPSTVTSLKCTAHGAISVNKLRGYFVVQLAARLVLWETWHMKPSPPPHPRHEDRKVQKLIERILQMRAKIQQAPRVTAA